VTLVPDVPDVPEGLNDRAADSWEPLLSVADAAGADWPTRARAAALALSAGEDAPTTAGMRLLADIRDVFGGADHLATTDLLAALHDLDVAPWGSWYGAPLTARELAKLLLPYGIRPARRRIAGDIIRGYFAVDLADAWKRYVPTPTPGTPGTPGTVWDPETATDDDAEDVA
jgi:hypothetical protein